MSQNNNVRYSWMLPRKVSLIYVFFHSAMVEKLLSFALSIPIVAKCLIHNLGCHMYGHAKGHWSWIYYLIWVIYKFDHFKKANVNFFFSQIRHVISFMCLLMITFPCTTPGFYYIQINIKIYTCGIRTMKWKSYCDNICERISNNVCAPRLIRFYRHIYVNF